MRVDLGSVGVGEAEVAAKQIGPIGIGGELGLHLPRLPPPPTGETPGIGESGETPIGVTQCADATHRSQNTEPRRRTGPAAAAAPGAWAAQRGGVPRAGRA